MQGYGGGYQGRGGRQGYGGGYQGRGGAQGYGGGYQGRGGMQGYGGGYQEPGGMQGYGGGYQDPGGYGGGYQGRGGMQGYGGGYQGRGGRQDYGDGYQGQGGMQDYGDGYQGDPNLGSQGKKQKKNKQKTQDGSGKKKKSNPQHISTAGASAGLPNNKTGKRMEEALATIETLQGHDIPERGEDGSYTCKLCTFTVQATNVLKFMSHLREAKHNERLSETFDEKYDTPETTDDGQRCAICVVNFESDDEFQAHTKSARHIAMKRRIYTGGRGFDDNNYNEPVVTPSELYYCKVCYAKLVTARDWELHVNGKKHVALALKIKTAQERPDYDERVDYPVLTRDNKWTCLLCHGEYESLNAFDDHSKRDEHTTKREKYKEGTLDFVEPEEIDPRVLHIRATMLGEREEELSMHLTDPMLIIMNPEHRTEAAVGTGSVQNAFAVFATRVEASYIMNKFWQLTRKWKHWDIQSVKFALKDEPELVEFEAQPPRYKNMKRLIVAAYDIGENMEQFEAEVPEAKTITIDKMEKGKKHRTIKCFVEFETEEQAAAAFEHLNSITFLGYGVDVQYCYARGVPKRFVHGRQDGKATIMQKRKWANKKKFKR